MAFAESRGKFIVIEGGEGSGKSSLVSFLKKDLKPETGIVFTKEPGGTELGDELRKIIIGEKYKGIDPSSYLFLFSASRAELLEKVIRPALKEGKTVICDRFILSTYAYQIHAMGRENLIPLLEKINSSLVGDLGPDLYIYLDVVPDVGLARIRNDAGRGGLSVFDKASEEFHTRVREGYKKYLPAMPGKKIIMDTTNMTVKEVGEEALDFINQNLNIKVQNDK